MILTEIWSEITTHLEEKQRQLYDEIAAYPPPIPACDAQFNYLLAERAQIGAELRRAQALSAAAASPRDLLDFLNTTDCVDAALAAAWAQKLARPAPRNNMG